MLRDAQYTLRPGGISLLPRKARRLDLAFGLVRSCESAAAK